MELMRIFLQPSAPLGFSSATSYFTGSQLGRRNPKANDTLCPLSSQSCFSQCGEKRFLTCCSKWEAVGEKKSRAHALCEAISQHAAGKCQMVHWQGQYKRWFESWVDQSGVGCNFPLVRLGLLATVVFSVRPYRRWFVTPKE
ncbi:hypothetical protein RRG08_047033 [Elysia crispata]|uniref:Uncharacterized protein n=1 Tax=Elysia crispata TaxID=231223 RepID=A0AAE1E6L4_9GAST|nr:hypothetical protein RRG08_047033 [Elysia crispata]